MKKVIKRDGRKELFNKEKIVRAVELSFEDVEKEISEKAHQKALEIANYISAFEEDMSVEQIQDIVEEKLMASNYKNIARNFITYRYERTKARERNSQFMKDISEKLAASNVQNQNANVDEYSFGGRIGEAKNSLMKKFALDYIVSNMARENHINNEIYIHDLDSYAVGMHNCCSRDTKFITDKGVYSFEDFNDGDKIKVLSHNGKFKSAIVKCFGKQLLNKITFIRAGQREVEEKFTDNHRWLLANGEETTNLKIGDKIMKAPIINKFIFENASDEEKKYWCLGFVLGDGTNAYRWSHGKKCEDIRFVRLRLCQNKIKYLNRFDILEHSTKEMENGDFYLTFSSKIEFIKKMPDLESLTWKEKLALFDGLYCADGQHSGSRKSIFTSNEEIGNFIEDFAPTLGYYIINIKDYSGQKTNYGIREFAKEYIFMGDENKYYWIVSNIEKYQEEDVWCLEVDDDHSFILPNGIVTGNCLTIPFDKLLKEGFNTRQTDVRPARSINTAFQLVAVLFQLQSLQQFGGVSASHLDWTMVPYVRISFHKHYVEGLKYIEGIEYEEKDGDDELSIDSEEYKFYSKVYKYAMDKTEKELMQAVQGMYHNLNY